MVNLYVDEIGHSLRKRLESREKFLDGVKTFFKFIVVIGFCIALIIGPICLWVFNFELLKFIGLACGVLGYSIGGLLIAVRLFEWLEGK